MKHEATEQSQTLDGTHPLVREERSHEPPQGPHARLRVLYHTDLSRIGALSYLAPGDAWLTVGRRAPLFVGAGAPADAFSLDDPTISREQLRLRWEEAGQRFAVEPAPGAKRGLFLVWDHAGAVEPPRPITRTTSLAPGSCIAVDDRLLLALELTPRRYLPPEARLGLVGESPELWRLREEITEVASFRGAALLLGPTGAGKELVAQAIHQQSERARGPFVTVNCAALPEHLVESLLFGHKRGAFTGAEANQAGLFRAADQGTLFLDELGEMPIQVQPKLLRALQDGLVSPVGEHKGVKVEVRVIAATNRDPAREISAGRMREDLYHRLATHVIRLPALRERRSDIPELLVHFLRELRAEHPEAERLFRGGEDWRRTIPLEFFVALMRSELPGNVRELRNVAARTLRKNLQPGPFRAPALPAPGEAGAPPSSPQQEAVAPPAPAEVSTRAPQEAVQLAAASRALGLAQKTVAKLLPPEELARAALTAEDSADRLRDQLAALAAERLFGLLAAHDFSQRAAAAALEMSPMTLIKLMQRFGLPRAADLSAATIQAALAQAGGAVEEAAQALQISPQALKRYLAAQRG